MSFRAKNHSRIALPRIAILFGLFLGLSGPAFGAAVPCSSLGFDPEEEGGGVLERFFVEAEGVGGLGCWMHPHPNGKDAIFTPFSWGRVPNPGKQGLIDETMTAISETSEFLDRLGTVESELYLLLTDLESDFEGEAYVIENNRCWIEIYSFAGWGAWGEYRRELKSTIAHEISHCFFNENFEDYNEEGTGFDAWWDESGSEYLMAQVYPAVDSEHPEARKFDLDGVEFMQEYAAVALLQHYSNLNGQSATLEFLRTAWRNGREHSAYVAYLDTSGLDSFFHDFNARHFGGTVMDPGGGNMPRESLVDPVATLRLDQEFGRFEAPRIEPRRLIVMELNLPNGYVVDIEAPEDVNREFHASIYVYGQNLGDWADGITIEAQCDVDANPRLLLTSLRTDGTAARTFRYRTRRIADCDCTDYGTLDACLVGSWEMKPESRADIFGKDGPVGGRVGLDFTPSGTFVYRFSNLSLHGVSYTSTGNFKMEVLKSYNGTVRGCARVVPQGRRLDGAIPMRTEVVSDAVQRRLTITHAGAGTTTAKVEAGLEAWFWPHKPSYYRCEGDTLYLEKREYTRSPN